MKKIFLLIVALWAISMGVKAQIDNEGTIFKMFPRDTLMYIFLGNDSSVVYKVSIMHTGKRVTVLSLSLGNEFHRIEREKNDGLIIDRSSHFKVCASSIYGGVKLSPSKLFEMFPWLGHEGVTIDSNRDCWYVDLDNKNYQEIVNEISWNCYREKTFEDICPRNKK